MIFHEQATYSHCQPHLLLLSQIETCSLLPSVLLEAPLCLLTFRDFYVLSLCLADPFLLSMVNAWFPMSHLGHFSWESFPDLPILPGESQLVYTARVGNQVPCPSRECHHLTPGPCYT